MSRSIRSEEKAWRGGTKLKVVHPANAIPAFNMDGVIGEIAVALANFGRYQTGTTIQAPVYIPPANYHGCDGDFIGDADANLYDLDWKGFVLLNNEGCSYETKARNV